jgi:hypothetical protein
LNLANAEVSGRGERLDLFDGHRHVNWMGWQKAFAWGMVAG